MAKKTKNNTSGYLLPPDARHFIQEDLQVAPSGFFDNMTSDQLEKPSLIVVQRMSRLPDAVKNIGTIYNTVTKEYYESIEIAVVVAPGQNDVPRIMKAKKFGKDGHEVYDYNAPIVCGSANGVYPYRNYVGTKIKNELGEEFEGEIIPEECNQCIFNSSGVCKQFSRYFVLQIHPDKRVTPAVLRLKGLAFQAAKSLNTQLMQLSSLNQYWTFTMSVEESNRKAGDVIYVPNFEPLQEIKDQGFLTYVAGMRKDYYAKQERILADNNLRVQQLKEDNQD